MTNLDGINTNQLLHKLRDEKPPCRVCQRPCDPDLEPGVDLLMIDLDHLSLGVGLIPVHQGACKAEALARLRRTTQGAG